MAGPTIRDRIRHCLDGVDLPADKDALADAADRKGCSDVARALQNLPAGTYTDIGQVLASVTASEPEKAQARRSHTKPGPAEAAKDPGTHGVRPPTP